MTCHLSPAAQRELSELEAATANSGDWLSSYLAMLEKLAGRNTSDMTEWEIRGQGIEALEKSREKYGVAVELKAYAIAQLPTDISAALAKLPKSVSLDDFLDRLMPNTAKSDRHDRLLRFFAHECDECVDDLMELHPRNLTRDETISAMALSKLEDYERADLSQQSQYWLHDGFMAWWKTQDFGNHLSDTNERRKMGKAEKLSKMLAILPMTNRALEGMTSQAWEERAAMVLNVRGGTFRRYKEELTDSGAVAFEKGKFRIPKGDVKKRENKT